MDRPTNPPVIDPIILPDVATQPHPTSSAIPEPPGTPPDVQQETVSDGNPDAPPEPTST